MTPRFLKMFPWLFEWEGRVWENDQDDPGNFRPDGTLGGTKYGIDARSHPKEDIRNLTEARAKQIYFDSYWQANNCEAMPPRLGEVYFNACVNCGAGRAKKLLAESGGDAGHFLDAQMDFYRRLVDARPKSQKYFKGWGNRVTALRKMLGL